MKHAHSDNTFWVVIIALVLIAVLYGVAVVGLEVTGNGIYNCSSGSRGPCVKTGPAK